MKRHFKSVAFVAVLAVGTVLGILQSADQVAAGDRVPGPEATTGASGSTSSRANYHVDYHADYRANASDDRAKGTEDSSPRRDGQRDFQPDWRNVPGMDWYGRTPWGPRR